METPNLHESIDVNSEQLYTFNREQEFIFMAQIQKESVRQQIIDAAVEDIYDNGYKDSSMRRIAIKAQMTVGNLYRYFRNKDELINFIIQPILDRINEIIQRNTNQMIDLNDMEFDLKNVSFDNILSALDDLSYELVNIYYEQPRVLVIMMMHTKVNEKILKWLTEYITEFMKFRNYINDENIRKCQLLARSYAVSLFAGVQECLMKNDLEKNELSEVIRLYFHSCIMMIDKNFEKLEV